MNDDYGSADEVDESVTVIEPEVSNGDEEPSTEAPTPPTPPEDEDRSLPTIAKEVVEGKWGVGQERRLALDKAGYNVSEVDEAVSKLLNP